ncbi:type VI secretion system Vgr family protein [Caballeronia sordidicola]|uniref:VgrG protein n=1 Tax=Caballeronia sordidicola TaxID=196367 RepID=A0A226WZN4_CABSO|nr:type VI secretion system tip protein VgrG [Caballeronia sordidicola]OXC76563.1 VgrG protein [Caballeronia sordidicola]
MQGAFQRSQQEPPSGKLVTGRQAYTIEVPGTASAKDLSVVFYRAHEGMSEPYSITVEVTHPDALIRAHYLGRGANFIIAPEDGVEPRRYCGVITHFIKVKKTKDFSLYTFVIEAYIGRLRLTLASRTFQHVTAPQIIEAILLKHGFLGHQYHFRLRRTYPEHAFRMQYQISDFDYIHVVMQQEGIFFYVEQGKYGDEIVFGDDIDHYVYLPELKVPYREKAGLESGVEAVFALQTHAQTVQQSFMVADYNPLKAWERFKDEANIAYEDTTTYGQSYVYGTSHLSQTGAQWEAQLRHEAAIAWQVVYEGESTVLELRPGRILRIDEELADAPSGQVIIEVWHSGGRGKSYQNAYKSIPSDRRFRLKLEEHMWPKVVGSLSARVTSPKKYKYAFVTKDGHYIIRLDLDWDPWNPGGESVPLRLAKPFAGALQTGFHFPAIDGTEAVIQARDGDPNKLYISHFHHTSLQTDLITSQDRWMSRNVLRTQSNNKVRMEDWEGQEHVKVATEYGKSQLTLGHMVNARREERGGGFELRTDDKGSVRAGKGLFLSADLQAKAQGKQLEMSPAMGQLQVSNAQAQGLADAAAVAKAEIAALKAESQWLKDSVAELKQAVMVLSAPGGIALATPDRLSIAAGKDVNVTASTGIGMSALRNVAIAAGDVLSLFAHKLGIKLFAARGKVLIQAQSDAIEMVAAKDMHLTSAEGTLTANAANGVVLGGGGTAYSKVLADDVHMGGAGKLFLHFTEVVLMGPGGLSLPLPKFEQLDVHHDEMFTLSDTVTGRPLVKRPYKIQLADGKIVEGVTGDDGETLLSKADIAQGMKLLSPFKKG